MVEYGSKNGLDVFTKERVGQIFLPSCLIHPSFQSFDSVDWQWKRKIVEKDGRKVLLLEWENLLITAAEVERGIIFTEGGPTSPIMFAKVNQDIACLQLCCPQTVSKLSDWVLRPDGNGELWREIRGCCEEKFLTEGAIAKISLLVYFRRRNWHEFSGNGWLKV